MRKVIFIETDRGMIGYDTDGQLAVVTHMPNTSEQVWDTLLHGDSAVVTAIIPRDPNWRTTIATLMGF
jgi:hypothetical protein